MRIIRHKLENINPMYPLEKIAPVDKILFIDIETTGFTAKSSILYLIGCAYYSNKEWNSIQWFATKYEDEKEVLISFFEFIKNYSHLIHFNGNNFDLPFLLQKCKQHGLTYDFSSFQGIDIYRRISPYRAFLKLPNCKQKTIEEFLNINRTDTFNGGELISVYHAFVKEETDFAYTALTEHNVDDLRGMINSISILAYSDLFAEPVSVKKVQANYYRDINDEKKQELVMKLSFKAFLPKEISFMSGNCYFTGTKNTGSLRVPLYEEEMKYFYSNYKDYYYLPIEDVAIHKSVSSYVDKEHRIPAKASTCYTRKISSFLQEWSILFEPFFKRDYQSHEYFFELTDSFKTDRNAFADYAKHVLEAMAARY